VARAGPKIATARGARIGRGTHATAPRVAVWPVPRVPLLATRGPRPPGPRQVRRGVGSDGGGRRPRGWRIGGAASRVGGTGCAGSVAGGVRRAVALGARGESSLNGDMGPGPRPGPSATDAAAASGAPAGTTGRSPQHGRSPAAGGPGTAARRGADRGR